MLLGGRNFFVSFSRSVYSGHFGLFAVRGHIRDAFSELLPDLGRFGDLVEDVWVLGCGVVVLSGVCVGGLGHVVSRIHRGLLSRAYHDVQAGDELHFALGDHFGEAVLHQQFLVELLRLADLLDQAEAFFRDACRVCQLHHEPFYELQLAVLGEEALRQVHFLGFQVPYFVEEHEILPLGLFEVPRGGVRVVVSVLRLVACVGLEAGLRLGLRDVV